MELSNSVLSSILFVCTNFSADRITTSMFQVISYLLILLLSGAYTKTLSLPFGSEWIKNPIHQYLLITSLSEVSYEIFSSLSLLLSQEADVLFNLIRYTFVYVQIFYPILILVVQFIGLVFQKIFSQIPSYIIVGSVYSLVYLSPRLASFPAASNRSFISTF